MDNKRWKVSEDKQAGKMKNLLIEMQDYQTLANPVLRASEDMEKAVDDLKKAYKALGKALGNL